MVRIAGCFTPVVSVAVQIPEGYPSGQRGQTVNLLAYAFGGSNPPPSTSFKMWYAARMSGCDRSEPEVDESRRWFDSKAKPC